MSFGYRNEEDENIGRPKGISVDLFYQMVAQKVDNNATSERARKYGEAIIDVLYEQLNENGYINWYGMGIFRVVGNVLGGRVMDNMFDISKGEHVTREVGFSNKIKFKPSDPIIDGINAEVKERPHVRIGVEKIKKKKEKELNLDDQLKLNQHKNRKYDDMFEMMNKKKKRDKKWKSILN